MVTKAIYLASGIHMDGYRELLGLWIAQTEGAKYWMKILTELQNRRAPEVMMDMSGEYRHVVDTVAITTRTATSAEAFTLGHPRFE